MTKINFKIKDFRPIIIFAVSLFAMGITLYAGSNVILTDNGDYLRVTGLSSLEQIAPGNIRIVFKSKNMFVNILDILFNLRGVASYPSSQLIFVRISVVLNIIINFITGASTDTYNVFYLGFMCCVLYALALTFTLTRIPQKNKVLWWIAAAFAILMMCDIGYTGYFNSLYAEGLQHMLLIVLIGYLIECLHQKPTVRKLVFFNIYLILYGTSKPFNIPCAILIGIVYIVLSFMHQPCKKDKIINFSALGITVFVLALSMAIIPKWIGEQTNYNAVFFGVVRGVDDDTAKDYLEDLGADSSLYELKNTHYYVSDIQKIESEYDISSVKELSYTDLVFFYAKHPLYTISKIPRIVRHSAVIRNIFFMDNSFMNDMWRFSLWSHIRENAGFDTIFLNLAVTCAFLLAICMWIYKRKNKWLYVIPVAFFLCIGYSLIMPYVANGDADLTKHMYMLAEFIDIMILYLCFVFATNPRKFSMFAGSCILVVFVSTVSFAPKQDVISFGGYEWYVINETPGYKTLICCDPVKTMAYSSSGTNYYEESSVRKWLNLEFYDSLSKKEKKQLLYVKHKAINSVAYKNASTTGNRDFYCSPYPEFASEGYSEAYGYYTRDYVMLPNVTHLKLMESKGINTKENYDYWLETTYFNNGNKVRYVDSDGIVYFAPAERGLAVRPVIYLKNNK